MTPARKNKLFVLAVKCPCCGAVPRKHCRNSIDQGIGYHQDRLLAAVEYFKNLYTVAKKEDKR